MNCYTCTCDARRRPIGLSGLPQSPAVAVCHECGAGVCFDHAVVLEERVYRPADARLLACPTCAKADVRATARNAA